MRIYKILLGLTLAILLVGWLVNTPAGLLGKADAIGYAVCHRIPGRSFFLGDRPLPMCARCSGMYLGALVGLLFQLRLGKRGGLPPLKILLVFIAFFIAFGIDGVNSFLHLVPNAPVLYSPQNWLRLLTGSGLGITMSGLLLPVFNQSMWKEYDSQPALGSWRELLVLMGLMGLVDLAVISENPLLIYPLALLSAAMVLVMLTLIYTILVTLVLKRENTHFQPKDLLWVALSGLTLALLQIALIDIGRFILTGTWEGFTLLG